MPRRAEAAAAQAVGGCAQGLHPGRPMLEHWHSRCWRSVGWTTDHPSCRPARRWAAGGPSSRRRDGSRNACRTADAPGFRSRRCAGIRRGAGDPDRLLRKGRTDRAVGGDVLAVAAPADAADERFGVDAVAHAAVQAGACSFGHGGLCQSGGESGNKSPRRGRFSLRRLPPRSSLGLGGVARQPLVERAGMEFVEMVVEVIEIQ